VSAEEAEWSRPSRRDRGRRVRVGALVTIGQQLRLTALDNPGVAAVTLQAWDKLRTGTRLLALIDISGSMSAPATPGGQSLEDELTRTAGRGILLFPDSTPDGPVGVRQRPRRHQAVQATRARRDFFESLAHIIAAG
jgi:hypothetical protein